MTNSDWLQLGSMIVTILIASGGVLRMAFRRIDIEVETLRLASLAEHKEIRRETIESFTKAYLELGEAPKAIRTHVNSMELWMRDNLLPRKEYERDQDQVLSSVKVLTETIERRFSTLDRKLDEMRKG